MISRLVTQRKSQECLKLREEELAEEKRKQELAAEEKMKKDEARKLLIQGMKRNIKMKTSLKEELNQISKDYMELYVD
jgi:hypothetical protein